MKFKNLEMTGFKSFSEKTTILIEKGLTGIVGPNGCGKSNIVESLRWCMGETSAKSMRGSGMEDVIFSGTSNKPSKNIAEVVLSLNYENKDGPHQYNDLEEIEIKRKIEALKRVEETQIIFSGGDQIKVIGMACEGDEVSFVVIDVIKNSFSNIKKYFFKIFTIKKIR